jgi:serine palmitoyltransferase
LIAEWTPEPIVPHSFLNQEPEEPFVVVESATGAVVTVGGEDYCNYASTNFLGLANNSDIKKACRTTIEKYGVGSCGPRGFYGSIDVHVQLEKTMSNFLGTSDTILYSDALACMASVIPAFAKTGDIIVADEHVNNGIQNGLKLSRSRICFYKHNDLADMEKLLSEIAEKAARHNKGKEEVHRRFIVVEGIYQYTGEIVNLKAVVELAKKYKFRIILDDSLALGVIGATGRGSCEHWGVKIDSDVSIVCAALDSSIASVGGICTGSKQVVSHQRLSGSGYCFSASSPPYTATAATVAVGLLAANPELPARTRARAAFFRAALRDALVGLPLLLSGSAESPVLHLRLDAGWAAASAADASALLRRASESLRDEHRLIATLAMYLPSETLCPAPSIRLNVTALHAEEDLTATAAAFKQVFATLYAECKDNAACSLGNTAAGLTKRK